MFGSEYDFLIEKASDALENAYCPYSKFAVGAAILSADGKMYGGCNVENASYSLSLCAERNALTSAVADGQFSFNAIAIYHNDKEMPYPCGACLQVLAEFNKEMIIIVACDTRFEKYCLAELLPKCFTLEEEI